jgi:hypothetical protein
VTLTGVCTYTQAALPVRHVTYIHSGHLTARDVYAHTHSSLPVRYAIHCTVRTSYREGISAEGVSAGIEVGTAHVFCMRSADQTVWTIGYWVLGIGCWVLGSIG